MLEHLWSTPVLHERSPFTAEEINSLKEFTTERFVNHKVNAPVNPGQDVRFVAMAFDLNLPAVDSMPVPEVEITLDNVTREVMRHLDAAVQSQQMIEVTYRPYLSNDLSGPQMDPPLTLVLSFVEANPLRITARARMVDIGNKAFPGRTYTAKEFPGLTR